MALLHYQEKAMRKKPNHNFFWPSYADLMTSLFFLMLVFYVLSFIKVKVLQAGVQSKDDEIFTMKQQASVLDSLRVINDTLEARANATEKELEKIKEVQTAVKELPSAYFSYDPIYKRFTVNRQIQFDKSRSYIKPEYKDYLIEVGRSIESLIDTLQNRYNNENIKYLIIIEGMASEDAYTRNFELSYERALALYRLWQSEGIYFAPSICELQISGSGTGGVGRSEDEPLNQRFLIQILPKIGEIN